MKPKLEFASKGPFVVEAQTKLNALLPEALPPLKPDGYYGEKTVARVKALQTSRGLVADGVVGAKTWAALDGAGPEANPSPAPPSPVLGHQKGLAAVFGMWLKCSCGTQSSPLMGAAAGTPVKTNDCRVHVNIMPFGKCTSPRHPGWVPPTAYEDPLLGAALSHGGAAQFPPCTPALAPAWHGAFGAGTPVDRSATCPCKFGGIVHFK